jgi:predicted amidohydrolase
MTVRQTQLSSLGRKSIWWAWRSVAFLCACFVSRGGLAETKTLSVAIAQMAATDSISMNCQRIVERIHQAAHQGARLVAFPEAMLRGKDGIKMNIVDESIDTIRAAARKSDIYVMFGGCSPVQDGGKLINWMMVVDPSGVAIMRYEKLFDNHSAAMPDVFSIDGIPCAALICADRWLRGVEELPVQKGACVSFELSNNRATEWIEPLQNYWSASRARRNRIWTCFVNSCNDSAIESEQSQRCHGHSAVFSPDGSVFKASVDNQETTLFANLEIAVATRDKAIYRATHPAMQSFWDTGLAIHAGKMIESPSHSRSPSFEQDFTIAIAQVHGNLITLLSRIAEARSLGADLVAFPAEAIDESRLAVLQSAAQTHQITVIIGVKRHDGEKRTNSAYVIGTDGSILTRYDQLSALAPDSRGLTPHSMWFQVSGLKAFVTVGDDAQWTELAELAAVCGARIHIHIAHRAIDDQADQLRQLQDWATLASFETFTATVNVRGSAVWEDLHAEQERRADRDGLIFQPSEPVEIYSPYSANLVRQIDDSTELLVVKRRVPALNKHYPDRSARLNRQMSAWYRFGANLIQTPFERSLNGVSK